MMTSPRVLFVGRSTLDALYRLDSFPAEDTKVYAGELRVAPGGPALNGAVTHALLGGTAVLVSAVGGGPWAHVVRERLQRLRIDLIDLAEDTAYETPLITVLLNAAGATRTIVNPPLSKVALRRLQHWDVAWGELPGVVLTDGFHLNEMLPLLSTCRLAGAAVCLDGGSWKAGTEALVPLLSVAICSERFRVPGESAGPDATLRWWAANGVPQAAVTRGAKPIIGWDRGRRFEIAIQQVAAVDTLGAGDVLHGAFCYSFARTGDFEFSLRTASEIATRSCMGVGIGCWRDER